MFLMLDVNSLPGFPSTSRCRGESDSRCVILLGKISEIELAVQTRSYNEILVLNESWWRQSSNWWVMGSYKHCLFFTRKLRRKVAFEPDTDGGNHMGPDDLLCFLAEAQGEAGATLADAKLIVDRVRLLHYLHHLLGRPLLTLVDFHSRYLFSDELNPPIQAQVRQDMTAPLSHYYMYTGHNSYLTGNQLNSKCSDVPIIEALQRGVRVIELDLWPNSAKDNVKVFHGRTLTKPVKLIKCLRSIKEYAFCASEYPVVITLEDHLTPDLQAKLADMITGIFGDMLYYPQTETLEDFPSPDALKKMIIISSKRPKENNSQKGKVTSDDETSATEFTEQKPELEYDDKNSAPQYRLLITIHAQKPKGRLGDSLKLDHDQVKRLSLSEQEFVKAAASHRDDVVRFTQKNLIRIYPKGTRITSSNYKPLLGWRHGAQMVAFNMQGHGRSLWLMHGFFRANGGCGYVKKPDFLLEANPNGQVFDPKARLPVKKTLKVKVYMGDGWRLDFKHLHFDVYSPPDFYMKVGIVGVPADTMQKRTRTIYDDWTPVWDEEFGFPLTVPELALLSFKVRKCNTPQNDFGGQTCLPVLELRPGIRAVPLYDHKGVKLNSAKLLVRFEFV
ncbi:phosphoinositide phospholipase C 4-like [Phoenix dactylifera]|uniref:Phosphoinositide phospholipase C n=1 Tax=Phoenix dactylifera TaxID=42345 RepID=A0A8B9A2P8_PHODC|nr:phosphoinositide phospholipase C 4-like [Phoenix dactylifera]